MALSVPILKYFRVLRNLYFGSKQSLVPPQLSERFEQVDICHTCCGKMRCLLCLLRSSSDNRGMITWCDIMSL